MGRRSSTGAQPMSPPLMNPQPMSPPPMSPQLMNQQPMMQNSIGPQPVSRRPMRRNSLGIGNTMSPQPMMMNNVSTQAMSPQLTTPVNARQTRRNSTSGTAVSSPASAKSG